jgi:hypothetical protein
MLFHQAQSFSREFKLLFGEDHTVEIEISYPGTSISTTIAQPTIPEISLLHSLTARR